jgi:iron-sulfur cluster repair protein YtfE (RIC family)
MRWFIIAALIYFLAGAVMGLGVRFGPAVLYLRFVHVHLMLLGFMAMMIYGIGYFIVPRFNATTIRWPKAVAPHFWIANIALWGMVTAFSLHAAYGSTAWNVLFISFSLLQAFAIALFVFNLVLTIIGKKEAAPAAQPQAQPAKVEPVQIRGDMTVGDIVEKWPEARQILADSGLKAVSDDEHFEQIKQMGIPLRMACMRHGIDLNSIINKLTKALSGEGDVQPQQAAQPAKKLEPPIRSDYIIGDVIASFPATEEVFRRYYGAGCFDCPGQSMESVSMSASLHNLDEAEILEALNEAISAGKEDN